MQVMLRLVTVMRLGAVSTVAPACSCHCGAVLCFRGQGAILGLGSDAA